MSIYLEEMGKAGMILSTLNSFNAQFGHKFNLQGNVTRKIWPSISSPSMSDMTKGFHVQQSMILWRQRRDETDSNKIGMFTVACTFPIEIVGTAISNKHDQ